MVRVGGLQQKVQAGIVRRLRGRPHAAARAARTHQPDRPRAGRRAVPLPARRGAAGPGAGRHRHPRGQGPDRRRAQAPRATSSAARSSRCSRRWPSTRATRSRTCSTSRSTWPSCCKRPRARRASCSPSCRCRPSCRASCRCPAEKGHVFVPLETVIRLHLDDLFPGMTIDQATVFRVTRDSEYEIDDDEVEDLLKTIEEEVRKRRRGAAVRLEIEADAPAEVEQFLIDVARPGPDRRLPRPGPARPDRPVPDLRPARLPAPARPAVRAAAGARVRQRRQPLGGHPRPRHPRPPPLRVVRPRRRFHRGRRRRRPRAGHQADALPHQQRLARSSGPCSGRPTTASR